MSSTILVVLVQLLKILGVGKPILRIVRKCEFPVSIVVLDIMFCNRYPSERRYQRVDVWVLVNVD